ncbi:FAD-binding protein [Microbulbifer sp. 2201CG32-9]|uniref:FAD-binding protein n=1 Tax=Microbulbifer sp. 2201CG32-9 TaxID=3232309 RepID=UPI00345BF406
MLERDCGAEIQARVEAALDCAEPLSISGAATREAFNLPRPEMSISLADHSGVIDYQPDELVLRVRSGTRLEDIAGLLQQQGQRLAADVPRPAPESTIGGAIATGWDGPERAFGVSLRDTLLGCGLVNGQAQLVNFGGQVMKNVAGYDLSRLQVGALGTLGVLLDVSLRLSPVAEYSESRAFQVAADDLPRWWQKTRQLRPLLRACCVYREQLHLRLQGRERAVVAALAGLGGEPSDFDWDGVRDLCHPFFHSDSLAVVQLPRFSLPRVATGETLIDWEGARVWVRQGDYPELVSAAQAAGGFVRVLRGGPPQAEVPAADWHRRIKQALDPRQLFNPSLFARYFADGAQPPCR